MEGFKLEEKKKGRGKRKKGTHTHTHTKILSQKYTNNRNKRKGND